MNQVLFLALAVGLVGAIELATRIRSHLVHSRRTKQVSEALDRLEHEEHLGHSQLQVLLDRDRFWAGGLTMCTSESERDALIRSARAELGPPAEILNRPEYDAVRRVKLENLFDFDKELRRRAVSAANAQVRLDRWRTESNARPQGSPAGDSPPAH